MLLVQFNHSISTLRNIGRQRDPCASFGQRFYSWCFFFVSYFFIVSRILKFAGATSVVLLLRQGSRSGILPDAIQIQKDQCPTSQAMNSQAETFKLLDLVESIIFHLSFLYGQEQVPQCSLSGLVEGRVDDL